MRKLPVWVLCEHFQYEGHEHTYVYHNLCLKKAFCLSMTFILFYSNPATYIAEYTPFSSVSSGKWIDLDMLIPLYFMVGKRVMN